ncbi:MAG TPA: arginine--tRNA ligase [Gammaproteobacteria bacterium]|nr:arginine--tRNA ligase [Gammaproteobacteria bacterium]
MKTQLKTAIANSIAALQNDNKLPLDLNVSIQIERARDPRHGDFACNIALILGKQCKQNPQQLADDIVAHLPKIEGVEAVTVAKPGFINFSLADSTLQQVIPLILAQAEDYGRSNQGAGRRIHVEVVSANPTGPLHVGHGRLAAFSASCANLLEAYGFQVHREYYVNDAGRQMRILAVSVWLRYLELFGESITIPRRGYKGDYIIEIARELKIQAGERFYKPAAEVYAQLPPDDETTEESYVDSLITRAEQLLGIKEFAVVFEHGLNSILRDIHDDLLQFGVSCQTWFRESQLHTTGDITRGIEKLRQSGYLYEKDGATWFRSTDFGDEKDRVVVRENGQPTYFASDVGYHLNKLERGFDELLDIYGADHHGYIPRLRALVTALGENVDKVKVLLVQFAILYRGKTRVSMSTRGGEFVTLRELRNEVGNDAARFFYIMRRRDQHLDFDLELAKSQSSDNPVYYIQYAHARICSVFRQLQQKQWQWDSVQGKASVHLLNNTHEKDLLNSLSRYPEIIETAATAYEPGIVAHYLQELANHFHAYYNAHSFLVDDAALRNARLSLITATRQVLHNGLTLLGLTAPNMM